MTLHRVKRFGIELEGGWDDAPPRHDLYKTDGSVTVQGAWAVGEVVSPILTSWEGPSGGREFMLDNYPDHVGASCGLHVHMSFGDLGENEYHISRIADSVAYQTELLATLNAAGKRMRIRSDAFWHRLKGGNEYCKLDWSHRHIKEHDRYRAVNFCSYGRHGTVEVRVLPMFRTAEIAARMVRLVLAFTDDYLGRHHTPVDLNFAVPLPVPEPALEPIEHVIDFEPNPAPELTTMEVF